MNIIDFCESVTKIYKAYKKDGGSFTATHLEMEIDERIKQLKANPLDCVVIKADPQAVPNGGSADEIYIKGKIDGLEEARWQVVYAIPHIDPNGRLAKQTKYIMDKCKEVQDELKTKL
jgi:hypothetical protein